MKGSYDEYLGRILAVTASATDAYAEVEITMPSVVGAGTKSKEFYVPCLRRVDLQFTGLTYAIGTDASLRGALSLGGATLYAALPTALGVADPNAIVYWQQDFLLVTSGLATLPSDRQFDLPGDGVIVTASSLTLHQHNTGTATAVQLAARIWYDFVLMDEMTYMRALHGLNV